MYEVNWSNVVKDQTPPRLYKVGIVGWLSVLVQSVQNLHVLFTSFTQKTTYDLNHNGQVVYLKSALNDSFDFVNRGITITNAGGSEIIALFPDGDLKEVVLNTDASEPLELQSDGGYDDSEYDFVVNVPFVLTSGENYQMRSLLDKYKLASKRPEIRTA